MAGFARVNTKWHLNRFKAVKADLETAKAMVEDFLNGREEFRPHDRDIAERALAIRFEGYNPAEKRKSDKLKMEVLEQVKSGASKDYIAEEYGISKAQIGKWVKEEADKIRDQLNELAELQGDDEEKPKPKKKATSKK